MNTPPVVQASLLKILRVGLLNIRCQSERDYPEQCAIEANHLHNIPGLLDQFSLDSLKYYIDIEIPEYVRTMNDQVMAEIRGTWTELSDWISKQ